ncbi:hypothetical protein V1478_010140 [Vespula squamosa]|uniref:Uncharacterized protein n=1 Tax=Vespula squamosa TaxID=30214 RepID=A0ABD2AIW5_VESSQ
MEEKGIRNGEVEGGRREGEGLELNIELSFRSTYKQDTTKEKSQAAENSSEQQNLSSVIDRPVSCFECRRGPLSLTLIHRSPMRGEQCREKAGSSIRLYRRPPFA